MGVALQLWAWHYSYGRGITASYGHGITASYGRGITASYGRGITAMGVVLQLWAWHAPCLNLVDTPKVVVRPQLEICSSLAVSW